MRNAKEFKALPYNRKLKERARELRKAGILHEVLLWRALKSQQLNGLDFDRQKIIGNYIVDFYCAETRCVIEIDGASHEPKFEYDRERQAFLENLGLVVIRLSAAAVLQNLDGVVEALRVHPALCRDSID
jgi:very-short-patch-repair endonuclease